MPLWSWAVSMEEVAALIGRPALVPAWVPSGFELSRVAVKLAARPSPYSNDPVYKALAGTGIVSLRYESGFEAITVTTRKLDPTLTAGLFSVDTDPFIGNAWPGSADARTAIELEGGAFAGARGNLVIGPLTIAHLWVVEDGTLLTVAGDASAEQLLAIARSIQT